MGLKFDDSELRAIFDDFKNLGVEYKEAVAEDAAQNLKKEIQRTAPKDSGKYAKSWRIKQTRWGTGKDKPRLILSPAKKYHDLMVWLEFTGTKPHIILPRRAKVLHWIDKSTGQHRFSMRVRHPGTKPQPHIRPALRKILPRSVSAGINVIKQKYVYLD